MKCPNGVSEKPRVGNPRHSLVPSLGLPRGSYGALRQASKPCFSSFLSVRVPVTCPSFVGEECAPRFRRGNLDDRDFFTSGCQIDTTRHCKDNPENEIQGAMTSIALSPAPGIIGLGVVAALAAPALCSFCGSSKRTVDKHGARKLYEDGDGASIPESARSFGNKSAKTLVILLSAVGVVVASSRLILTLRHDDSLLLSLQPWFHLGVWVSRIRIHTHLPPSSGIMLTKNLMNTEDISSRGGRGSHCLTGPRHCIQPRTVSIAILRGVLGRQLHLEDARREARLGLGHIARDRAFCPALPSNDRHLHTQAPRRVSRRQGCR